MTSELLNQKIDCYKIIWRKGMFHRGPGIIQKMDGTLLGHIKAGGWINRYISIVDTNDKVLIKSYKNKIHSYRYTVKDQNQNPIGIVHGKTDFSLNRDMKMKNEHGEKILELKTNDDCEFEIKTNDGKIIAKDIFMHLENSDEISQLKILDLDYERKKILGLYISFLSSTFDKTGTN